MRISRRSGVGGGGNNTHHQPSSSASIITSSSSSRRRQEKHRQQSQQQRLIKLLLFVIVLVSFYFLWTANNNEEQEEASAVRRQRQWAEEGLPLNHNNDNNKLNNNINDQRQMQGRQRTNERRRGQRNAITQQQRQKQQQQRSIAIHATSNIDTVVQYLTKLAEMPPTILYNNILGIQSNNYGKDPFMLRDLEEGKCPWPSKSSSSSSGGGKDDSDDITVEWLPPLPFDSTNIAQSYRENAAAYKSDGKGRRQRAVAARMGQGYDVTKEVVIWYEHLSKAGGTTFCGLATSNMERWQVPRYHCMPRKGELMDGRVGSWTNVEFVKHLQDMRHGIVANEWDPFSLEKLQLSGRDLDGKPKSKHPLSPRTLFVTTLRDPSDRLLSAYTFFALTANKKEETNSDAPTFQQWINNNHKRLGNYIVGSKRAFRSNTTRYNHIVWRFSGGQEPKDQAWKKPFETAIRALTQHDLILPMDIMTTDNLGKKALQKLFGWDKFEASGRGATGDKENGHVVTFGKIKNSNARAYFGDDEFRKLWEENWLDHIVYLWSRAVFLARLHCEDVLV